jgi:hypothetical protein
MTAVALRLVSFAKGQDVTVRDRLVVTMGGSGAVVRLEVLGSPQPHSYEVLKSVLAKLEGTP